MITDFTPDADQQGLSPDLVHAQALQGMAQAEPSVAPNESPNMLADALLAPFRGAEGAVRNTYGLLDFMTGDALPDYDHNFLGTSKTGVGNVIEGASQFLIPFLIPGVGAASLASKAGQAINLAGKVGTVASKAITGAVGGAAVDFAAFNGHEERLSNFIENHPSLANPITEFLAADPEDSEIEGRFKATLEGAGLGGVTDALLHGVKAVKLHRLLASSRKWEEGVAATKREKELREALDRAAEESDKALSAVRKTSETELVEEAAAKKAVLPSPEQVTAGQKALAERMTNITRGVSAGVETGGLFQNPDKSIYRMFEPDLSNLDGHLTSNIHNADDLLAALKQASESAKKNETATVLEITDNQNLTKAPKTAESIAARDSKVAEVLADFQGLPTDTVARTFREQGLQFAGLGYSADAALAFTVSLASEIKTYAKAAVDGGSVIKDAAGVALDKNQLVARALKGQQLLSVMSAISKGYGTTAARVLNARKYIAKEFVESQRAAKGLVEDLGGFEFAQAELNKIVVASANANPREAYAGVIQMTVGGQSFGDRLFRMHNEYWLNAILSGSKTSAVNIIGNTLTTLYQPAERALGSLLAGDMKGARSAIANYGYIYENIGEAWKFAKQAWLNDDGLMFGKTRKVSDVVQDKAIQSSSVPSQGWTKEATAITSGDGNLLKHLFNFVGENVRLPQRFLLTTDEFFKQVNYRAAAKANLWYQGAQKGLQGEALARFIADRMQQVVTEGGRKFSEGAIYREALAAAEAEGLIGSKRSRFVENYVESKFDAKASALRESAFAADFGQNVADEATFTRELGKIGKGLQSFASSHPAWQLILPFVRTPTNIIKYFGERGASGVQLFPGIEHLQSRNLKELTSADPLIRSNAAGRMAAGQMFVTMAGLTALEGKITGSGPSDQQENALLQQTGWRPRSIVINSAEGPVYFSYDRLDPFATFLGIVADTMDLAKRQDPHHANLTESATHALVTAFTQNVTNKSYMQSLAKFVDMVQDPNRRFASWGRARVASYIPSALAQFTTLGEDGDTLKEIRSVLDAAMSRLPGAQGALEVKRNILGESIEGRLAQTPLGFVNPVTVSRDKNDVVFDELAKFGHGLQAPNPVLRGKIPLLDDALRGADGRTAYDQYQQKIGEVKVAGKTLREALTKVIDSREYKKLPEAEQTGMYDTPRLRVVKSVINTYREAALVQLQKENPKLKAALGAYFKDQVAIAQSRSARNFQDFLKQAQ